MKPEFPHYIDNTMRKVLVKCQKAAHYRFELGLQSKAAKKVDLVAGGAFAAGIERVRRAYFVEKLSAADAAKLGVEALFTAYGDFQPPKDTNKTAERMAGALLFYLERFPLEQEKLAPFVFPDGSTGIELDFHYPIGIEHPESGRELEYCGRFDMLAVDLEAGGLWVVDEKTTSSMGEKWANQWPLDSQMSGYVWGAERRLQEHGVEQEIKGAIINGVAIKKYDYDGGRFKTYREPWEVQRWLTQMKRDVLDWKVAHQAGNHMMNLDHSCAYYLNPCEFAPLCKSRNPERLFEGEYVVEFWNPRERT